MSIQTEYNEGCYQKFCEFSEERIKRKNKKLQEQIAKVKNVFEKYAFSDTVKLNVFQNEDYLAERKKVFLSMLDIKKLTEEVKKDYYLLYKEENPECYRLHSEWKRGYLYQYIILVPRNEELYPLRVLVERYIELVTYSNITLDVFCEVSRSFLITKMDLLMRTLYSNQELSLDPVALPEKEIETYFKTVYLNQPVQWQVEGKKTKFERFSVGFEEMVKSFYEEIKDKRIGKMVEKKLILDEIVLLKLKGVNKEEEVFAYLYFEKDGASYRFKAKHKVSHITLKGKIANIEMNDEFEFSEPVVEEGILADFLDRIQKES